MVTSEPETPAAPEPVIVFDQRAEVVVRIVGDRPLSVYAHEMLAASDAYGIDWRFLPVMSVLESSGGVHACGGNAWGYGSCGEGFKDWPDFSFGIWRVALALSEAPYAGNDFDTILCIYVSGHACWGEHAQGYRDRAHWILEQAQ